MKRKYEKKGQPDKASLRELLARDGREHLLPLVNVFALAGGAPGSDHRRDRARGDRGGAGYQRRRCRRREAAGEGAEGRGRGVPRTTGGPGVPGGPGRPGREAPGCAAPARASSRSRRTRRSGGRRGLGERMLELLLAGLSTRSYGKAIGEMAEDRGCQQVLGEPSGG